MRGRTRSLERNQCSAAVKPTATIKPRTIIVVTSENLRSVLIKFSPFYYHTKSDITHFTVMKKSPSFIMISVFTTSFRQDRPKFHAYTICVLAIDPFLTLRVVFPAYRNIFVVRKVCKGKRLPCEFAGAEVRVWSEMEWQQ